MSVDKQSTKQRLLDAGESFIIESGYGNFSFRDIAEEVGIKSASVHYHYPTKGDLVAAVMERYTEQFAQQLPDPMSDAKSAIELLEGFIAGFKGKIVDQHNMSLCTILTADKPLLPERVATELAQFYELLLNWLTQVFMRLNAVDEAEGLLLASQLLATLHGASILVQGTNDSDYFDRVLAAWRKGIV
ncbi:TetR/AcrR family transcriptional regulator [Reinekea thalattae]|uniref:TetR/AcrR family transcriptional regulator n=1 Tax=Reinekea thalattae TaxID=2593301 RepID=A0A5C8ZBQ9_9GAMM|nr:TetR/AcrR family transcriptional regulator [Reinekea thalattae]TXR54719.1 TetR/AcrR family transcriptional regulator [Reinekea thalattae]